MPLLGGSVKDRDDVETAIERILADPKLTSKLKAIALTSGVEESAQSEVERIAALVQLPERKIRSAHRSICLSDTEFYKTFEGRWS